MLENLRNTIHQGVNELFVSATMDEMTGDIPAYKEKLCKIAQIAEILDVGTEITTVSINLKG
jgi:hypothetical protein